MTGKLFGILLMALIVILAWKWLRGGSARPPAPRPRGDNGQRDERREKVIELEQDADGVYRPKNDQDDRTKKP